MKMDNFVKSVYVNEIKDQCAYAVAALKHSNSAFEQLLSACDADSYQQHFNEIFRNIHSFLTHASNVSRMFWPSIPRKEKSESDGCYKVRRSETDIRAKALKEEYSLTENNVLKNTSLRNHLEHYDERLDNWSKNSKNKNIATVNIGPLGSIRVSSDALDSMRHFDPDARIYRFRGEDYDLQNIETAISEILFLSQKLEEKLEGLKSKRT